jgi:hypothetical protein
LIKENLAHRRTKLIAKHETLARALQAIAKTLG